MDHRGFRPETGGGETFAKMPFGRPAVTDEIAAMVVFLTSDLPAYASGTIVTIDGGLTYRSQP